jgi:hypothetical protein
MQLEQLREPSRTGHRMMFLVKLTSFGKTRTETNYLTDRIYHNSKFALMMSDTSASHDDDVDEWSFYDEELHNSSQHAMDDVDMFYTPRGIPTIIPRPLVCVTSLAT